MLLTLGALGACQPTEAPEAAAPGPDSLLGSWSVESRDQVGTAYSGTLEVTRYIGHGTYLGDLELEFTSSAGVTMAVVENAKLDVDGTRVLVTCSKAVVVTENGEYNADNFLLTRVGPHLLQGVGKDSHRIDGTITLTRK